MTESETRPRQIVTTRHRILGAGLIGLLIAGSLILFFSGVGNPASDQLSGGILIWHTFNGSYAQALDGIMEKFTDLHPEISVHQQYFESREELRRQYQESVESGLGPDVFIGDATWIPELVRDAHIRPIDTELPPDLASRYLPAAIASLTYNDRLYGLPESLHVPALYYNATLVTSPPETLDALLTQAAEGHTTLISTDFRDALWGVQAFGGRFFDEEGRAILDQGGYANWLDWLLSARAAPGMILDGNRESLRERFLEGDVSYYVGYPEEMELLIEAFGVDGIGVAPLPGGPTGSAGPVLGVEAFLFSPVSSRNQREISIELADFLTNSEQSATMMRDAGQIPANTRVRINPRLHPLMAGFLAQARAAIPLPSSDASEAGWALAALPYNRVLNGLSTPVEAALETTAAINEANGFDAAPRTEPICSELGTVRLVHDWEGSSADALDDIIRRFKAVCPLVIVSAEYADLDSVRDRWRRNPSAATNPDIILAPQTWLIDALNDRIPLKNISTLVSGDTLQRYLPAALTGMRADGVLLGLPVTARVNVLYYNKTMVDEPAQVVERLRLQADNGLPITLEARFVPAHWGVGAFGARLLDEQYQVALDEGGFARWLEWLRQSRDEHGIRLTLEAGEAKTAFIDGESAYYVGEPREAMELTEALGDENLGVSVLPSGPEGAASPLFSPSGIFFGDHMTDRELAAALGFALFATNAENQSLLMDQAHVVPANATVDVTDHPGVATVLEQAKTAYPLPNLPHIRTYLDLGDKAYVDVLLRDVDPEQAAAAFTASMNMASDLDSEDGPTGGVAAPTETAPAVDARSVPTRTPPASLTSPE